MPFFSFSHTRLFFRIILCIVSIGFFGWILNENIPIAGIKKITYILGTPQGIITQVRPMARVGESGNDGNIHYQKIIESPVFFDIHTPIIYDTMVITMVYKHKPSRQFGIGIKQFPPQTDFFITPFTQVETRGEWIVGRAEISLKEIQRLPGRYSLSLSLPGLAYHPTSDEYLLVSRAEIVLKRKPLTIESFLQSVNEILYKK